MGAGSAYQIEDLTVVGYDHAANLLLECTCHECTAVHTRSVCGKSSEPVGPAVMAEGQKGSYGGIAPFLNWIPLCSRITGVVIYLGQALASLKQVDRAK